MQLTIQQKVFSLREAFAIMDGEGNKLYEVKGKILSIGHKLTVSDLDENPVMHIHQKVLSLVPKYFLEPEGGEEVELKGHITLLKPHYTLELPSGDWEIRAAISPRTSTRSPAATAWWPPYTSSGSAGAIATS